MDDFILRRLKALASNIRRNNQLANGELNGKSIYLEPQRTFKEIAENTEKIVAELQDILFYAASGNVQPQPEHNDSDTQFDTDAYRNFGYDETPHGVDGMATAHIKQIATELLQARNCINRVHFAFYGVMGLQAAHKTLTGEYQPQIFVDGMNKAFNLFEAARKAFTEAVNILCDIVDFAPTDTVKAHLTAIGAAKNEK